MRCFPVPFAHSHDPCSAQCGSARCPAVKGGLEFQFTADLWVSHWLTRPAQEGLALQQEFKADWTPLGETGSSKTEINLIGFFNET